MSTYICVCFYTFVTLIHDVCMYVFFVYIYVSTYTSTYTYYIYIYLYISISISISSERERETELPLDGSYERFLLRRMGGANDRFVKSHSKGCLFVSSVCVVSVCGNTTGIVMHASCTFHLTFRGERFCWACVVHCPGSTSM